MSLHTPQSIWAKYQQPMLELASGGIGVSLGENTFLFIRWSADLPKEQVARWFAFFAKCMLGPHGIAATLGIEPPGESSTVVSLKELRAGLALLTKLNVR
jgi:hypothetical protein